MELSGTHQLLVYADDILFDKSINTLNKNKGQTHNIKTASKSFKKLAKLEYLEMSVTSKITLMWELRTK
jgi:hypothetical protein